MHLLYVKDTLQIDCKVLSNIHYLLNIIKYYIVFLVYYITIVRAYKV